MLNDVGRTINDGKNNEEDASANILASIVGGPACGKDIVGDIGVEGHTTHARGRHVHC